MLPEFIAWASPYLPTLLGVVLALLVVVRRLLRCGRVLPPVWRFLLVRLLWWLVVRALGFKSPAKVYPRFRNRVRVVWEERLLEWLER